MPPPGRPQGFQLESLHHSSAASTTSQELPFLPQPGSANYPSVDVTATPPTSSRADLDHASIARLSRHLLTNNAEINSTPGDVNTEHQAKTKRGRMPHPEKLKRLPPHRLHSTNPSLSVTPSVQSMPADLRFHPYSQPSHMKLVNSVDKANTASAGNHFIAQMCLGNCWMKSCNERVCIARKVLIRVNNIARTEGHLESLKTSKLLGMVSRCAYVLL